jgi:hypothetical protein
MERSSNRPVCWERCRSSPPPIAGVEKRGSIRDAGMMAIIWDAIAPWLIAGVGGSIGAALLLPTKLGEALFKHRFDKAIEGYKAEQGKDIEKLREQLSHLGDRGRRSNELEFAAIRDVWEKRWKPFSRRPIARRT